MLRIVDLSIAYGGIQALRGVTLEVAAQDMVAVVGPNGAGKSTLLNAASGLVRPRAGRILFEGEDLAGVPGHEIARRGLLQVPEGRQILGALSVLENLEVGRMAVGARGGMAGDLDRVYTIFPLLAERRRAP